MESLTEAIFGPLARVARQAEEALELESKRLGPQESLHFSLGFLGFRVQGLGFRVQGLGFRV